MKQTILALIMSTVAIGRPIYNGGDYTTAGLMTLEMTQNLTNLLMSVPFNQTVNTSSLFSAEFT